MYRYDTLHQVYAESIVYLSIRYYTGWLRNSKTSMYVCVDLPPVLRVLRPRLVCEDQILRLLLLLLSVTEMYVCVDCSS